jgi:hypothetical protein
VNLETLFDDLEASFDLLQTEPNRVSSYTVSGYSRVVWGNDNFAGFLEGSAIWQIVAIRNCGPVTMIRGDSNSDGLTLSKRVKKLIGLWVRIEIENRNVAGRLIEHDGKLLFFQGFCIHVASVKRISLHAVDN